MANYLTVIARIKPGAAKTLKTTAKSLKISKHSFTFHQVFEESTQSSLYAYVNPIVYRFIHGSNGSLISFGPSK